MKRVSKSGLPEVDLKGVDFVKQTGDNEVLRLIIVWKGKDRKNEEFGPVLGFAKHNGAFKIINKALPDYAYVFDLKDIKQVILFPEFSEE